MVFNYCSPSTQLLSDDDDDESVELEGLFSDMHIMYTCHALPLVAVCVTCVCMCSVTCICL